MDYLLTQSPLYQQCKENIDDLSIDSIFQPLLDYPYMLPNFKTDCQHFVNKNYGQIEDLSSFVKLCDKLGLIYTDIFEPFCYFLLLCNSTDHSPTVVQHLTKFGSFTTHTFNTNYPEIGSDLTAAFNLEFDKILNEQTFINFELMGNYLPRIEAKKDLNMDIYYMEGQDIHTKIHTDIVVVLKKSTRTTAIICRILVIYDPEFFSLFDDIYAKVYLLTPNLKPLINLNKDIFLYFVYADIIPSHIYYFTQFKVYSSIRTLKLDLRNEVDNTFNLRQTITTHELISFITIADFSKIELTYLNDYFMNECVNLMSVTLPSGLQTIGHYVLAFCSRLKKINLDALKEVEYIGDHFLTNNNIYYINMSECLCLHTVGNNFLAFSTSLVIKLPPNLRAIGEYFLAGTTYQYLDFTPLENLSYIPKYFLFQSKISNIDLRPLINLTTIDSNFLNECPYLESVDISDLPKLNLVGASFMCRCKSLKYVNIGKNVKISFYGFMEGIDICLRDKITKFIVNLENEYLHFSKPNKRFE